MVHGVGIEIVSVDKFKAVMERRGEKFLKRLFTANELKYCRGHRSPEVHLCARFAAKSSLFKALGRTLGYSNVEVVRDVLGAPELKVEGAGLDGYSCSVSMAHTGEYSIAETVVEVLS
jgi:holo-[acyl-carrier protein] synthase